MLVGSAALAAGCVGAPPEDSVSEALSTFAQFANPVNIGPVVNTKFKDQRPTLSKSGLSLYFGSNRDPGASPKGTAEKTDLYVSQRASVDDAWGAPVKVDALNSDGDENAPAFSTDGHWVYFSSDRDGYCGATRNYDLWAAHRQDKDDDFGWETPVHLGCDINSPAIDDGPQVSDDENGVASLYFNSNRAGGLTPAGKPADFDIYLSPALSDDHVSFGAGVLVAELSTPQRDTRMALRRDGLEIFVTSNRTGSVPLNGVPSLDIWVATRATTADPWSTPVNAGPDINTPAADGAPTLSWDGQTLFYDSTVKIPGVSQGDRDIYYATRHKKPLPLRPCSSPKSSFLSVKILSGDAPTDARRRLDRPAAKWRRNLRWPPRGGTRTGRSPSPLSDRCRWLGRECHGHCRRHARCSGPTTCCDSFLRGGS